MREKPKHPRRWLWWAALLILFLGAAFSALSYYTMPGPRQLSEQVRQIAMFTFVGVGICVISATAHWWTNR